MCLGVEKVMDWFFLLRYLKTDLTERTSTAARYLFFKSLRYFRTSLLNTQVYNLFCIAISLQHLLDLLVEDRGATLFSIFSKVLAHSL